MIVGFLLALAIGDGNFQTQFDLAGDNRLEIERAIREVPESQKAGMSWLITHMPENDLQTLTSEFLLTNCDLAYESWASAPWKEQVTEEIFFDCILPYANVNERRDDWRADFRERFFAIVEKAETPTEATILLNKTIFDMLDVHYSTKRPKADQSPYESIDAGMASCSGLSILLVDACRSVGVPARFVGTPLWYNESGNHSWIEFWDEGWHYTGAAEPTGNRVDESWFDASAAKATKGHPKHAILAVSWNASDKHFPLVWLPDVETYGAIDVTEHYAEEHHMEQIPLRVRAIDSSENRQSVPITLFDQEGNMIAQAITKDESADANDHTTFFVDRGSSVYVCSAIDAVIANVDAEEVLTLRTDSLSKNGAKYFSSQIWNAKSNLLRLERQEEVSSRVIKLGEKVMPFWYTKYGDAEFGERSLWISLHGGGGAPPEVNTSQWENQKHLYKLEEGVYLAPRAPTDTWNLWHQSHVDPMLVRLIENMILFEGVDPNKVYLIGYSAGGDGVFQLASRMSDRFAGAGMMAGHPNETRPDGLRNISFALHMGAKDGAYARNEKAIDWKHAMKELQSMDANGYRHQVVIHEDKGHWMDGQDSMALPWLAKHERNPFPKKIVWVQDDVLHNQMYWMAVENPAPRSKIVASIDGQNITVHESDVDQITFYLNDDLLNLEKPISVSFKDDEIMTFDSVPRSKETIKKTMRDATDWYSASITVQLP